MWLALPSPPLQSPGWLPATSLASKLLIKFHIYDQKIKPLALFEIGFYEFGLGKLSQQSGGLHGLKPEFLAMINKTAARATLVWGAREADLQTASGRRAAHVLLEAQKSRGWASFPRPLGQATPSPPPRAPGSCGAVVVEEAAPTCSASPSLPSAGGSPSPLLLALLGSPQAPLAVRLGGPVGMSLFSCLEQKARASMPPRGLGLCSGIPRPGSCRVLTHGWTGLP